MDIKSLSSEELCRIFRFIAEFGYPKETIDLKKRVEIETRKAKLNISVTGTIDFRSAQKIFRMNLELECLYLNWARLS